MHNFLYVVGALVPFNFTVQQTSISLCDNACLDAPGLALFFFCLVIIYIAFWTNLSSTLELPDFHFSGLLYQLGIFLGDLMPFSFPVTVHSPVELL